MISGRMGWLRLVGSLELLVSFAVYSLFYRALLLKRPIILRSLLIVATPYASDTPLLVQDSRITCCSVPFDEDVVTVLYWYKSNPKMGSKLKMGINIQDIYPRLPRLTPAAHSRYYIDYI